MPNNQATNQPLPDAQQNSRLFLWLLLATCVVGLDQLTKYWVVTLLEYREQIPVFSFFSWVRWHNDGAAFSFLAGSGGWQRWFFITLALAISAFLIFELRRLNRSERMLGWIYSLILGGAIGNMLDRVNHGYVVDFLAFHYQHSYFPAFNVADSALFCGCSFVDLVDDSGMAKQSGTVIAIPGPVR